MFHSTKTVRCAKVTAVLAATTIGGITAAHATVTDRKSVV
jgi:hypothetical protein